MPFLADPDRQHVQEELAGLSRAVRLVFFTQTFGCDYCPDTKRLLDEIASLSDRVTVEERNLVLDTQDAAAYAIDRAPAIAFVKDGAPLPPGVTGEDARLRFYGLPAGYEFISLLEGIKLAGGADPGLSEETQTLLAGVTAPLHIQVFVTPG